MPRTATTPGCGWQEKFNENEKLVTVKVGYSTSPRKKMGQRFRELRGKGKDEVAEGGNGQ